MAAGRARPQARGHGESSHASRRFASAGCGPDATSLATGCVLFGLGVGNLTSLPPLIAQREFRAADVGVVVALVIAINQGVFALAPAILGWLHDLDDSYILPFLLAGIVQIAASAIVALGRRFS